jgi:hypothetical protein
MPTEQNLKNLKNKINEKHIIDLDTATSLNSCTLLGVEASVTSFLYFSMKKTAV